MSQEAEAGVLKCDNCGTPRPIHAEDELPPGWIPVRVRGWVGNLHCCSAQCMSELLDRCATEAVPVSTN